jgi:hypothetical protein
MGRVKAAVASEVGWVPGREPNRPKSRVGFAKATYDFFSCGGWVVAIVDADRKFGQQLEGASHAAPLRTQHDLVTSTQDLDFPPLEAELLRQLNGLAVAGPEHAGRGHGTLRARRRGPRLYTTGPKD